MCSIYFSGNTFSARTEVLCDQQADDTIQQGYHYGSGCYCVRAIGNKELLVYDTKHLAMPKGLQGRIIAWYYYLWQPRHTCLKEIPKLLCIGKQCTKGCSICQQGKLSQNKHGNHPVKQAIIIPWKCLCVDVIGQFSFKDSNSMSEKIMISHESLHGQKWYLKEALHKISAQITWLLLKV